MIRIFNTSGKLLKTIKDSRDVVRALCKLPAGHPSGAQFASAGNDGIARLFTLNGDLVGELHGHESFIYSIAVTPSGELVTSGEDRTVRIWRGNQCVQTITHPAISVWGVAVCKETGDIVTGASDRVARIFTKDTSRQADPAGIQQFENAVKESAIPQQQVGNINKEKLPGPEFLKQKSGTKDGQVQMIREDNGSVTAHTWSSATQEWIAVGTVVDSAGSSGRKTEYLGQDYDYVFDVDIEDGKPPLKLPYNLSQNPYEAATKFINDNELPIGYLDQVANFITQNTQGATIGQTTDTQQAAPGSDPWGQERRYRPGEAAAAPQPQSIPETRQNVLPQTSYLSIKTANIKVIVKKLTELNEQLVSSGNKDYSYNPPELDTLVQFCNYLENTASFPKDPTDIETGIQLVLKAALKWPPPNRLPGLDLLRLLAAATPVTAQIRFEGQDVVDGIQQSGAFQSPISVNNAMLAIRFFANLFDTPLGSDLAASKFDDILRMVSSATTAAGAPSNRNVTIAATTLYINYAVYFTLQGRAQSAESAEGALQLLEELSKIFATEKDSEAVYRGLVALGTLVKASGEEVKSAAKDIYELDKILSKVSSSSAGREPRVKGVIGEIRDTMR
jgi:phospholipase A-2-activating protein